MTRTQRIEFIKALLIVLYACPKLIRQQTAASRGVLYATFSIEDYQSDDGRRRSPGLGAVYYDAEWAITQVEQAAWRDIARHLPSPVRRVCATHLAVIQRTMGFDYALGSGTKTMRENYIVAIRGQGHTVVNLYEAAAICHVKPATLQWHLSRRGRFSTVLEVDTGSEDVTVTRAVS